MKVQDKLPVLILCLIVIGLMTGCGSTQTSETDQDPAQGFGVEDGLPAEEVPSEELPEEEVSSEEIPSEEISSEEENINVAYAFDIVVAWTVASSDLTALPENPVLVTMADSVMTVETECYMFSGRYTASPRLSISPLSQINENCENISAEEQALVDTLPKAHSFYFRGDTAVELAYGDGLIIVLEEQESYNAPAEVDTAPVPSSVSD